jgi:hypothetical protein
MIRLKFWRTQRDVEKAYARGRLEVREELRELRATQPEYDWVHNYVTSPFFLEFMTAKLEDVFDEFQPPPSPEYEAFCERAESHVPMEGLAPAKTRAYVVDDTRYW